MEYDRRVISETGNECVYIARNFKLTRVREDFARLFVASFFFPIASERESHRHPICPELTKSTMNSERNLTAPFVRLFLNRLPFLLSSRWDSFSSIISQRVRIGEHVLLSRERGKKKWREIEKRKFLSGPRISNANETAGPRANKSRVCKIWWHWPHDDARMHNHGAWANFLKHTYIVP